MVLFRNKSIALVFALTCAPLVFGHPGHEGHDFGWDFASGASHPWTGFDHLLALMATGLWAALCGGRSRWVVPAAALGALLVGLVLGHGLGGFSGMESGVAASVAALGLLVAFAVRVPSLPGAVLVACFFIFHGWAHGAEIPEASAASTFAAGMMLSAAALLAVGASVGAKVQTLRLPATQAVVGGLIAAGGTWMLLA
jgi:urease accessory protein